jgi:peptide/nickel transport system substrate-binding protein
MGLYHLGTAQQAEEIGPRATGRRPRRLPTVQRRLGVDHRRRPGATGIRIAALACAAVLAFAACSGSSSTAAPSGAPAASEAAPGATTPAETAAPAATSATGQGTEATFTYGTHTQVVTDLDPATSYSNEVIAMHDIYETLTRYDAATKTVQPALATSWTASPDGLTWTFKLRPGVTFHTGRPMDAAAAKAAIERTKTLNQGAGYIWGAVKSIEAPDAETLVFTLDYPTPLDLIASENYAGYVYDTQAAGAGAAEDALVAWFKTGKDAGTGPYTISTWKAGDEFEMTLDKYDGYWGGWDGDHYTKVVYRVVPEVTTAAQLLQSGDLSYADRLTPQLVESLRGDANLQVVETPSFQNLVALLNTASGPLADPNVRGAIAKAFDTNGIAAALGGSVVPAKGVIPQGLIGYSDSLAGTGLDLEGAAALLAKSGYGPGGKPLTITGTIVAGDTDEQLVMTSLKSNLAKLNINLDVQALEWQAQWDKAKSADASKRQDVFVMYWWPDYADPYSWFISLFHSEDQPNFNLSYYKNPDLDTQIDGVEALAATNRDAAAAEYVKMQQTLIDDAVVVVPYVQNYQRVLQSSVGNFVDNPAYANVVFAYDLKPGASN